MRLHRTELPIAEGLSIYCELVTTIEDLQARQMAMMNSASMLAEKADKTPEEHTELEGVIKDLEVINRELSSRQRLEALKIEAAKPIRKAQPAEVTTDPEFIALHGPRSVTQIERPRNSAAGVTAKSGGWQGFGMFARAVREAYQTNMGRVDKRLIMSAAAPTTYSSEGIGPDGGFAVPPEFLTEIQRKVMGEDSLLALTRKIETESNQLVLPAAETTPWDTAHGVQAKWEGEASLLPQSKPELQSRNIKLNKLTVLCPVTSELLDDATALEAYLRDEMTIRADYAITDALINGLGVGKPQGIMNSPSKVTVAAVSGQGAGTVTFANVVAMRARMYAKWLPDAVWIINQDVYPQLQSMALIVGSATTQLGFPAFMPAGGLSGKPYDTLMGHRIIVTEAAQALGTEGDIILVDWKQYIAAIKAGGPQFAISAHLYFDADALAYRLIFRVGGQSLWLNPITRAHGSNTLSNILTLNSTRT